MSRQRYPVLTTAVTLLVGFLAACAEDPPAAPVVLPSPAALQPAPVVSTSLVSLAAVNQCPLNAGRCDLTQGPKGTLFDFDGSKYQVVTFDQSTGTGVFEPFVRIDAKPIEQGYNTSGSPLQFDEKSGAWTHDLRLNAVPQVLVDDKIYRELRLDINEPTSAPGLSLDRLRIFISTKASITNANPDASDFGNGATLLHDLDFGGVDRTILLSYLLFPGSGKGDLRILVPSEAFDKVTAANPDCEYDQGTSTACPFFVYVYSKMGATASATNAAGLTEFTADGGGFEEWAVQILPYVRVEKTANVSFKRTYNWKIAKSVSPDVLNMFKGDKGSVAYKVEAIPDPETPYTDSDFGVSGDIKITNPSKNTAAVITKVEDLLSNGQVGKVTCPVTLPYTLGAGLAITCTYTAAFVSADKLTNTATVTLQEGGVYRDVAAVNIGNPTTEVNKTVTVTDAFDGGAATELGKASIPNGATFKYEREFACNADKGEHPNTATITETGQTSSAKVTVNCYELTVTKDAATELTRQWTWAIDKDKDPAFNDPNPLTLSSGQVYDFHYLVTVTAKSFADSKWKVAGKIKVANPAPVAAKLTSVTDAIDGTDAPTVTPTCSTLDIAAKSEITCTYAADLPDAASRTNTATATQQNYSYAASGAATATGTTAYKGTATVSFASAKINKVDDCAKVTDDKGGVLAEKICVTDAALPQVFTYKYVLSIGPFAACGPYTFENTATFTTSVSTTSTSATGSDKYVVTIDVPCLGCTLTWGYWKTHNESFLGGASKKADPTWALISTLKDGGGKPLAERTPYYFDLTKNDVYPQLASPFGIGQKYIEVMQTSVSGNDYYNLAHQYIAAKLNGLDPNGIKPPAKLIADVEAFFRTYYPTGTNGWQAKGIKASQLVGWASTLEAFNSNPKTHCSEDVTSLSP